MSAEDSVNKFCEEHPKTYCVIITPIGLCAFIFIVPILFLFQQTVGFLSESKEFWKSRIFSWYDDWSYIEDKFYEFKEEIKKIWKDGRSGGRNEQAKS